jgi:hypothetical protein
MADLKITLQESITLPNRNVETLHNITVISGVNQILRRTDTIATDFSGSGIEILKFVDKIATNKENIVAMRNTGDFILIDENAMAQKFNDKAWTKPAKQLDGSYATALKENEFNSLEEFLTFALIHEVKHDTIKKQEGETTGQYEDRINEAALEDLRANYNILDDADNNDLEGADNPNPCGK